MPQTAGQNTDRTDRRGADTKARAGPKLEKKKTTSPEDILICLGGNAQTLNSDRLRIAIGSAAHAAGADSELVRGADGTDREMSPTFDHIVNEIHGSAHLAEDRVSVVPGARTIGVAQHRL